MSRSARATRIGAAMCAMVAASVFGGFAGCAATGDSEERVVRYRPFFADNPEAWHGTPVVAGQGGSASSASAGSSSGGATGVGSLFRAGADRPTGRVPVRGETPPPADGAGDTGGVGEAPVAGGVKLVAGSVGQLFGLLLDSLSRGEHDLIARDLVGRSAKEHYEALGQNVHVFVAELARNQREVARTLGRMPMAERTPTVFMERIDAGRHQVWVLRLTGLAAKDLQYSRVWVELGRGDEAGTWRIVAIR